MTKDALPSPINKFNLSTLIHATEDESKVRKAINILFSSFPTLNIFITSRLLRGHYKNPIKLLNMVIVNNEKLNELLEYILVNLKKSDKTHLYHNLSLYFNKNTFYLRLDKQSALQGILSLNQEDSIKVQFTFKYTKKQKDIELILQRLLRNEKIC